MNTAILIGNIVNDPELRYTTGENQTATCRFRIAVNDGYGDKRETSFITIQAWRKQAENVCRYCHKGSKVCVTGKIRTGSYENKEGRKVYTFEIVASNIEFLTSKSEESESEQQRWTPATGFSAKDTVADTPSDVPPGFEQLAQDEDIPF